MPFLPFLGNSAWGQESVYEKSLDDNRSPSLFKKAFRPPLCALRLALRKKSCCQLQNLWVGSCPTWSSLQVPHFSSFVWFPSNLLPLLGQVRIQTFFPNQSLFISFVVLLAQWSNLEEGSWMFFSFYHHYGPYGQIDVVRIIVFRACPFSKDECPTHVISAKGFVSEVRISALSLLRGSTSLSGQRA